MVERLIALGVAAAQAGDLAGTRFAAAEMLPDGEPLVLRHLLRMLRSLYEAGWQPADVLHVISNRHSKRTTRLARSVVGHEAAAAGALRLAPPAWIDQVRTFDSEFSATTTIALGDALTVLAEWRRLPRVPHLIEPPSKWGQRSDLLDTVTDIDPRIISRIRGLLAKAEATEFVAESDTFTDKAQQLMSRYSIDAALLAADDLAAVVPSGRRFHITGSYAFAKVQLLTNVASLNNGKTVWTPQCGFVTVFGFDVDLALIAVMYESLLAQATSALDSIGQNGPATRTRPFRTSFLNGFASRVSTRLQTARALAEAEAAADYGPSLLPALIDRDRAVGDASRQVFPRVRVDAERRIDLRGWSAGKVAGDIAALDIERERSQPRLRSPLCQEARFGETLLTAQPHVSLGERSGVVDTDDVVVRIQDQIRAFDGEVNLGDVAGIGRNGQRVNRSGRFVHVAPDFVPRAVLFVHPCAADGPAENPARVAMAFDHNSRFVPNTDRPDACFDVGVHEPAFTAGNLHPRRVGFRDRPDDRCHGYLPLALADCSRRAVASACLRRFSSLRRSLIAARSVVSPDSVATTADLP